MLCWFADRFSILHHHLTLDVAQEMSFVDSYVPYLRQWIITCPQSALLPF
jgi:hypothetical protein